MVGPKTAPPAEEGCTDLCLGNDSINNVDTMSINDATHALRTECLAAVTGRLSTSRSEREPPEIPRSSSFAFPPRMTRRTAAATGTAQNGKVGGLSSKFTNITRVRVSCPCLSLHHDKTTTEHSSSAGAASSGPSADRKEAEEHAVNLLSRPLVMVICGGDDTKGDHSQENTPMGDANGVSPTKTSPTTSRTTTTTAGTLLENIYESFAILVASRLHVYTSFLQLQASRLLSKKRHKRLRLSTAAGSKQQKKIATPTEVAAFRDQLHRILAIGAQIETLAVTTRFVLEENGTAIALVDGAVSVALLRFQVTIDTAIPLPSGRKEIVSVDFDTFGKMTGTFAMSKTPSLLEDVSIELNTRDLLNSMVQQAARVVSAVVEIASNLEKSTHVSSNQEPLTPSVPDSKPQELILPINFASCVDRTRDGAYAGLELLCNTAASLPVVSPVLSGTDESEWTVLETFDLSTDDDDSESDVVAHLSIDQCADIVDSCLFSSCGESSQEGNMLLDIPESHLDKKAKIED